METQRATFEIKMYKFATKSFRRDFHEFCSKNKILCYVISEKHFWPWKKEKTKLIVVGNQQHIDVVKNEIKKTTKIII